MASAVDLTDRRSRRDGEVAGERDLSSHACPATASATPSPPGHPGTEPATPCRNAKKFTPDVENPAPATSPPQRTPTRQRRNTMHPDQVNDILNLPLSRELLARDITRLAYTATDGTPRAIPIAFTWNGTHLIMCTSTNAPKLPALRANPTVALTIDTEVHPPTILLIRGHTTLDTVDGIPEEYLQMNGTYQMTPQQRTDWEHEVRSLYDSMVRIVVTPAWAKLIDFDTTLPTAVEELITRRAARQQS